MLRGFTIMYPDNPMHVQNLNYYCAITDAGLHVLCG